MAVAYEDLITIHNPAAGLVIPSAWGDQIRENFEALVDPPACTVFNSAAVSIATSTFTAMAANSELFDNDAMHSTVSNTSRITGQKAGRYEFGTTMTFAANTTGSRAIGYRVNGGGVIQAAAVPTATAGVNTVLSANFKLVMAITDWVEVLGWQNSGGNLNVTLDEFSALKVTR